MTAPSGRKPLLRRRQRGVAAVEFALIMPIVALALTAVTDYARSLNQKAELSAAVRIGLQVAFDRQDAAAGAAAVAQATTLPVAVGPPQLACACPGGGSVACAASSSCPGGAEKVRYLTLSASAPFTPLFPATWFGQGVLESAATLRLQ